MPGSTGRNQQWQEFSLLRYHWNSGTLLSRLKTGEDKRQKRNADERESSEGSTHFDLVDLGTTTTYTDLGTRTEHRLSSSKFYPTRKCCVSYRLQASVHRDPASVLAFTALLVHPIHKDSFLANPAMTDQGPVEYSSGRASLGFQRYRESNPRVHLSCNAACRQRDLQTTPLPLSPRSW